MRKRREARDKLSRNDGRSEQPSHQSHQALGNYCRSSTRLRPSNENSIGTRVGKLVDELVGELVNEWLANIARRVLLSAIIARESALASFLARRDRTGSRSRADQIKKNTRRRYQQGERPSAWQANDNERRHAEGASSVERRSLAGAFIVSLLSRRGALSLTIDDDRQPASSTRFPLSLGFSRTKEASYRERDST